MLSERQFVYKMLGRKTLSLTLQVVCLVFTVVGTISDVIALNDLR